MALHPDMNDLDIRRLVDSIKQVDNQVTETIQWTLSRQYSYLPTTQSQSVTLKSLYAC